jgi:hypothetical protein
LRKLAIRSIPQLPGKLYLVTITDPSCSCVLQFPFPIDAILAGNADRNLLPEEYSDLGFSTTAKPVSRRRSAEEAALLAAARGSWKRTSLNRPRGWQRRTPQGEVIEIENKREYWRLYDKVWSLLIAMNGRGAAANRGNFVLPPTSGPTFGQRARGLVESLNIPASEIAAAVVSGGLGVVNIGSFAKVLDKSSRSRGERCPRVVLRLVLLYLFEADLDAAKRCVQQFIALLPAFFSTESEQNKNRLQLLLWTLLDARTQIGSMDEGARFHVVSQLIREIVEGGKAMLATSLMDKDKPHDDVITASDAALHSLLQQDRILAAVKEEARYLKGATAQRAHEVEALRAELNTASAQESKQKKVLDDQIQTVGSSICASDRGRRVAAQGVYDEEQQAISVRRSFSYSFQTHILNWFPSCFCKI